MKSRRTCVIALFVLILPWCCSRVAAAQDVTSLLPYLSGTANSIAIVRVQDILRTPRARRQQWAEKHERFLVGSNAAAPWVQVVVLAALVHPEVPEAVWSVAVMPLPPEVRMADLARREGAEIQMLAGSPAFQSPRDSLFLQLAPGVLGVMTPPLRQSAARWVLRAQQNRGSRLTPYLTEVAHASNHIVLALDMQDMLDPQLTRMRLRAEPSLRSKSATIESLLKLVLSLRGVCLTVDVGETTEAVIQIDFSQPVGTHANEIKTLFLQALRDQGMILDDFADVAVQSEGRAVRLAAPLSDSSLRKVLSLLLAPRPASPSTRRPGNGRPPAGTSEPTGPAPPSQPAAAGEPRPDVAASYRYYTSVNRILDDVQRMSNSRRPSETAGWWDRYAGKIERLEMAGVDPELLEYGASIGSKIRAMAASLRGQLVEVNTQQNSVTYDVRYQPAWATLTPWGGIESRSYWRMTSNLQQVRQKQAEAVAQGAKQREQIWQMIADQRSRIRQRMQQKYSESLYRW